MPYNPSWKSLEFQELSTLAVGPGTVGDPAEKDGALTYRDFDAKLRMTALLLDCSSRKELVGRFHAANPKTECDLERMHKWLQGRSLPRAASIVEDWATVVGCARGGAWLAACALDEFAAEMARLFERDAQELLASEAFAGRGSRTSKPASAAEPRFSGVRYLCGSYTCYSRAWSPYAAGKLIRGALTLAPGRGTAVDASYSEQLIDRTMRMDGEAMIADRTLHVVLREAGGALPLFFSLFLPRPPAGVLCGMISGVTFLGADPEPSASPIVAVRLMEGAEANSSNRYLEAEPGVIAQDLVALGLRPAEPERVDRLVLDLLRSGAAAGKVRATQQAALSAALDPLHLGGAFAEGDGGAAPAPDPLPVEEPAAE